MYDKMTVPTDMSSVMSYVLKTMIHRDPGYKQMERERLDKQKIQYEQLLHSVLNKNEDTIKKCIYLYSDISNKIKTTKANIKSLKERLVTCKNVMSLDYGNLAYLFHNSAMYNETMTLLDKIEKFMNVSSMIDRFIEQKEYVEGAKLLKTTCDNYDSLLHHVNALSTIRIDLDAKFQKYYEFLIRETFRVLFELSPLADAENMKKSSQMNISAVETVLCDLTTSLIMIGKLPDVILLFQSNIYRALEKIIIDVVDDFSTKQHDRLLSSYKSESCSIRIFSTLLGTILEKFKTVSDHIKCFFTVISTRDLSSLKKMSYTDESEPSEGWKTQRAQNNLLLYDLNENMKTVWLQIHYALEAFLSCYLPVSTQINCTRIISKDHIGDDFISQIFSSRYVQTPRYQSTLFLFDSNAIAGACNDINNNPFKSIVQDSSDTSSDSDIFSSKVAKASKKEPSNTQLIKINKSTVSWLILKQNFHYIGYVFQTLVAFLENGCAYLEDYTGYVGTLNNYIFDYTENVYIPNVKVEFCEKLNKLMDDPTLLFTLGTMNYWKITVRDSPVTIGVLALFDESLSFIRQLSLIPHYANTYIEIVSERVEKFLMVYKNFLEKLYNPDVDDIHQILTPRMGPKSDLNDGDLKNKPVVVVSFDLALNIAFREHYQEIISKYNEHSKKSSNVLNLSYESYDYIVKYLSDRKIKECNLIQKNIHLKTLVTAIESLDWIHEVMSEIYKYLKDIKNHKSSACVTQLPLSVDINANLKDHVGSVITEKSMDSLKHTVQLIGEKYEILKLAVHLEIRIRCWFNLIPFFDPQNYLITTTDTTIDPIILHVVTDILDFVDICQNYLHVKNSRFVFSGLSVFLSKLFIDAVKGFKKINQNGVDKMLHNISALKRDLSGCDFVSDSLDIAIVYYEMLNKTPDEIFEDINEHGAKFTRQEYASIVALIGSIHSYTDETMKSLSSKLDVIFGCDNF